MKNQPKIETLYTCPDKIVTVVRKKSGLRRFPHHAYKCVLFLLKPKAGTRVCTINGGIVEFMPNFNELRSMLVAIDAKFAKALPSTMRNKPAERKRRYDVLNAKRKQKPTL